MPGCASEFSLSFSPPPPLPLSHSPSLFLCTIINYFSRLHYKEYLVHKINKNGLDPITIYSTRKIQLMLERDDMEVLEQDDDDTDDQYREKLIKVSETKST